MYVTEQIRNGKPFLKQKELAEFWGISELTVKRRVDELKAQQGKRYPKQIVISDGNLVWISKYAFADWLANRKAIQAGRRVKPFKASDWMETFGEYNFIREVQ